VLGETVRRRREAAGKRQEDMASAARRLGLAWPRSKIAALERGDKAIQLEEFFLLPTLLTEALGEDADFKDLFPDPEAIVDLSPRLQVTGAELAALFAEGCDLQFGPSFAAAARKIETDFRQVLQQTAQDWPNQFEANVRETSQRYVATLRDFGKQLEPILLQLRELDLPTDTGTVLGALAADGLAEERAASKLGLPKVVVASIALRLWGRSLSEERDSRVASELPEGAPAATVQAKRGRVSRVLVDEMRSYFDARRGSPASESPRTEEE
jgi:transcriptional regulator with XRE-family HTH domain